MPVYFSKLKKKKSCKVEKRENVEEISISLVLCFFFFYWADQRKMTGGLLFIVRHVNEDTFQVIMSSKMVHPLRHKSKFLWNSYESCIQKIPSSSYSEYYAIELFIFVLFCSVIGCGFIYVLMHIKGGKLLMSGLFLSSTTSNT